MDFSHKHRRRGLTEVNVTPLIDVVFNLLIFFVITTTFVQNPGIEVELPKASTAPGSQASDSVIIAITQQGQMIYEGRALSSEELRQTLNNHYAARKTATVIIQADEMTAHGKVVEVMDLARQGGFQSLAIATEAE